jgi:hypothetical protein
MIRISPQQTSCPEGCARRSCSGGVSQGHPGRDDARTARIILFSVERAVSYWRALALKESVPQYDLAGS